VRTYGGGSKGILLKTAHPGMVGRQTKGKLEEGNPATAQGESQGFVRWAGKRVMRIEGVLWDESPINAPTICPNR